MTSNYEHDKLAQPAAYKDNAPKLWVRYLHRCHTKVHSLHPKPEGLQAIGSTTRSTPPPQRGRPWKLAHG